MSERAATAGNEADERERAAVEVLQRYWGYPSFRSGQWRAMAAVLEGRDAFTILPTGGGKSLCYQVPALLLDGLTIVVSPLVALMDDQVAQLQRRGVRATFINSTLSQRQIEERWNEAMFGDLKLLYLAPERLQTEVFRARAERLNVSLLAVDEAHCISEWGHNFRPSYLKIAEARTLIGDPPTIAVTATATPYVRRDIQERLALRSPVTVITGFDRPNLTWSVFHTENKRGKVLEILNAVPGTGIVYAGTRRGTEEWAEWLRRQNVSAACYHGGLPAEARSAAQEEWIQSRCRIMVATNAFGMGIDKPDVRFVVHVDLPSSLESYYQEAGRGGRDGDRAYAVLLYQEGDEDTPARLLERSHPDRKTVRQVYDVLCSMAGIALGETTDAPIPVQLEPLARSAGLDVYRLRSVLEMLERQQVLTLQEPAEDSIFLRFTDSMEAVRAFEASVSRPALAQFVRELIRLAPPDAFDQHCEIALTDAAERLNLEADRVKAGLSFLQERGLVDWFPGEGRVLVMLNEARSTQVPYDESIAAASRRRSETRLADMVRYVRSSSCRRKLLLGYYGESAPEECGACDACLGRHDPLVVTPEHEPLLRGILEGIRSGADRRTWFSEAERRPRARQVDALIDWLVQEEFVQAADPLGTKMVVTRKGIKILNAPPSGG